MLGLNLNIGKSKLSVSEAATILLKTPMPYYVVEMAFTENGDGPATLGEDAASVMFEVWDAQTYEAVGSHTDIKKAYKQVLALTIKEQISPEVSQAAKVIKSISWPVTCVPLDKFSRGPAVVGEDAARLTFDTWYDIEKNALASFNVLAEATQHTLQILSKG